MKSLGLRLLQQYNKRKVYETQVRELRPKSKIKYNNNNYNNIQ